MNDKITVPTTQRSYDFNNPVKTILLYNDSVNTVYYNLEQNRKGLVDTDDIIIPPKTSRFIGVDETQGKRILFVNLIANIAATLYIDYTTWAESPSGNIDGMSFLKTNTVMGLPV